MHGLGAQGPVKGIESLRARVLQMAVSHQVGSRLSATELLPESSFLPESPLGAVGEKAQKQWLRLWEQVRMCHQACLLILGRECLLTLHLCPTGPKQACPPSDCHCLCHQSLGSQAGLSLTHRQKLPPQLRNPLTIHGHLCRTSYHLVCQ